MLNLERVARADTNRLPDAMTVLRSPLQRLQDQQIERSVQEFDTGYSFDTFCHFRRPAQ